MVVTRRGQGVLNSILGGFCPVLTIAEILAVYWIQGSLPLYSYLLYWSTYSRLTGETLYLVNPWGCKSYIMEGK